MRWCIGKDKMRIAAIALAFFLVPGGWAAAQQLSGAPARNKLDIEKPAPLVVSKSLAANGTLVLDVNVGDVRVVRNSVGQQIRLEIQPDHFEDSAAMRSWVKRFDVAGDRADVQIKLPKGDHKGGDVTLYVPAETALNLHLGIGDLIIKGVTGNKDLHVGIGDLTVNLRDAKDYSHIEGSTRIGDVNDQLYHAHQSGFLGKTEHVSESGTYWLRAHVGIGDISFVPEDEKPE